MEEALIEKEQANANNKQYVETKKMYECAKQGRNNSLKITYIRSPFAYTNHALLLISWHCMRIS